MAPTSTDDSSKATSTSSFLLEVPMMRVVLFNWLHLGIILEPLGRFVSRIRWLLAPPLQTRILPQWLLANCGSLSPTLQWFDWTVGELLLATPLLVWSLLCLHYSIGDDSIKSVKESGYLAMYGMVYTFLTANKSNSIFSIIFGLPFDNLVSLHRLASIATLGMTFCHTYVSHYFNNGKVVEQTTITDSGQQKTSLVEVDETWAEFLFRKDSTNQTGSAVTTFILALIFTSYFGAVLRAYAYQTWFTMHILLVLGIIFALFFHIGITLSFLFMSLWWGVDIFFRYGLPRCSRKQVCGQAQLRLIGVDTNDGAPNPRQSHEPAVELLISPKPFDYMPGQFVKVCIPAISMWEYHSVTISSAPQELDGLTVHFRALGDWTTKLAELARSTSTTKIWLEGPYGALSFDLGSHIGQKQQPDVAADETSSPVNTAKPSPLSHRPKIFVLVSGGIGVTPCQSLGKYLMYQQRQKHPKKQEFKLLKFVWAVRTTTMVDDIPPLALKNDAETGKSVQITDDGEIETDVHTNSVANVEIDIYHTRMKNGKGQPISTNVNDCYTTTTRMHAGRPNLDEILTKVKQEAIDSGETSIAVLGCGPRALMDDLQLACRKHGASIVGGCSGTDAHDVFIDLHIESFGI